MLSTTFSVEEFATRRRKVQDDALAIIQPLVGGGWDSDLEDALKALWADTYSEEAGTEVKTARGYSVPFDRLQTAYEKADHLDDRALALMLVTAVINGATIQAARDDEDELLMEWVSMSDGAVRHSHAEAHGQVRPIGEPFKVGEAQMPYPGFPVPEVEEWLNCRCVVRPTLAAEFASRGVTLTAGGTMTTTAAETPLRADGLGVPWYGPLVVEGQWSGDKRMFAENAITWRDYPLPLKWQKVGDDGHKGDVTVASIDGTWRDTETGLTWGWGTFLQTVPEADEALGLIAEFGRFGVSIDADKSAFEVDEEYGGIVFSEGRGCGATICAIPAFAEAWAMLGEMPDDLKKKMPRKDEEVDVRAPKEGDDPNDTRTQVGTAPNYKRVPEDEGKKPADADVPETEMIRPDAPLPDDLPEEDEEKRKERVKALTASGVQFVDVAPGRTEDGPGWLTNPVDTDRLRDYWAHGPGAAKIGWGSPGDFNRCRTAVAQYIKPQHLNGYCANRHFDALGFWPGRPVSGETVPFAYETMNLEDRTPAPALSLVASGAGHKAPKAWFQNPNFKMGDGRVEVVGHIKVTTASGEEEQPVYGVPHTVTDEGEVFGTLAAWEACHLDSLLNGECTAPPRSTSDYAYMRNRGVVLHDDGTSTPVAQLTLGGGHAGPNLSMRAALAHYDESGVAVADVVVGEDEFGIWYHGWVRPGTTPEQVTALRASAMSGDWREIPRGSGNLELIAALAVNVPGFGLPRTRVGIDDVGQVSLVASGIIAPSAESREQVQEDLTEMGIDYDTLAKKITMQMATQHAESLLAEQRIEELVAEFAE